ncbi:MAG: CvpA family protein [Clostridiales bacterium]|nr:CvpA family protein [Clostridiales bacterium]
MSLIIDIIIILAAVSAIYLGIMRGFVKSIMSFLSLILAIVATVIFTAPVSQILSEKYIDSWVNDIVKSSIVEIVSAGEQQLELSKIMTDKPEALVLVAARFGCDIEKIDEYYNDALAGKTDSDAINELAGYIASPTAETISNVVAAILVFIAALIALNLITFILDLICRLPVLNTLNTLLGMIFGIASALLSAWVISNIAVGLIRALSAINTGVFNDTVISSSIILRFFYNSGVLLFK